MNLFNTAMTFIRQVEGEVLAADGSFCGISQSSFTAWLHANGQKSFAVSLLDSWPALIDAYYLTQFWLPAQIADFQITPATALVKFDGAVNCGVNTMSRLFQGSLGMPINQQDGRIGPITIAAYQIATKSHGDQGLATTLIGARREYYYSLNDVKYITGWLNRLAALEQAIKSL